jgi:two-component sensor histidine kinase
MKKESPLPAPATDILHILDSAAVTVFAQDRDLKYRWITNRPASWGTADPAGHDDAVILSPTAAAIASALKRDVMSSGRAQWGDLTIDAHSSANGSARHFELFIEPERDSVGAITGICGLAIDVTDRRKQAETLEAVARDLSHRTKNLLAVIQSLAVQTARNAPSTDAFIDQFRGRIQSISRSQDISIEAKRQGAKLSELVDTQVVPYLGGRVGFAGLDCYLSPNAALHIGLALYELCIAAARDGNGEAVRVTAELDKAAGSDGTTPLRLTWHEGGSGTAGSIDGFGKVLLERIVPAAVGGDAALSDGGTDYTLTISAREFERGGPAKG